MKDFSYFTEGWWQMVFKTEECIDTCRPIGSSSWDYFLKVANKKHHMDDDNMLSSFGHTKRCGVCDIPMNNYEAIKDTLGEDVVASWKREGELEHQEILILCIYCLELMEVKEKGMSTGCTIKLASTNKIIDIIHEHPDTNPEYFNALKERPTCIHS